MQSGPPGQGRLDHFAYVDQFRDQLPLLPKRVSQGIGWGNARTANHRADTLAWLEQTHQFQTADGIAHGAATDAKHLHKLPFWRKQVAGFQLFRNAPLQLPGDCLVDLISGNRFESDSR